MIVKIQKRMIVKIQKKKLKKTKKNTRKLFYIMVELMVQYYLMEQLLMVNPIKKLKLL